MKHPIGYTHLIQTHNLSIQSYILCIIDQNFSMHESKQLPKDKTSKIGNSSNKGNGINMIIRDIKLLVNLVCHFTCRKDQKIP